MIFVIFYSIICFLRAKFSLIPRQLKKLEEVPSEELAHKTKSGKTEMNVVAGYSVAKKN